jgi:hypothetical protein
LLAQDGQVFTQEDMQRVAGTIVRGFGRLGGGILFGDVTGNPASNPRYAGGPGKWLPLAQYDPDARERLVAFYLNYKPAPSPLCLAMLLRFGKAE